MTEAKAAFAGVTLETSLARFKASMVAFNNEMTPSRSFGRWDFFSMVRARGRCEMAALRKGGEEESEPGLYDYE